jgi:hypothetical protein
VENDPIIWFILAGGERVEGREIVSRLVMLEADK